MALIPIPQDMTPLELEDLLTGLAEEQLAQIKMDNPILEQMIRDGEERTHRLASEALNKPAVPVNTQGVIPWVRLGLLDTWLGWIQDRDKTCIHNPTHRSTETALAAAWKPGLVVCLHCVHLLKMYGEADRTCDGCGRVCDELSADRSIGGISPVMVTLGSLIYQTGMCDECKETSSAYTKDHARQE